MSPSEQSSSVGKSRVDSSLDLLISPGSDSVSSHVSQARAEQLVINANEEQTGGLKTCAIRPAGIFG